MFSKEYEEKIQEQYESVKQEFPYIMKEINEKINSYTREEQMLFKYLYGAMPVSDMVNYPLETYLDYVKQGLYLWENGLYQGKISEELFCAYVVYHRVNTEDISACRTFFYEKTKQYAAASMEETVLAVNYWCAQEVTYRAADDRTASPMTVYRSGYGRCGEESTFTVSVFRSLGIPARQVYVPRWSHCDDNHAWVEVWCEGSWYFLGACEPEEIVNRGWFTHASSRAMLLHSRCFGNLPTTEEKITKHGITTELNQSERYAKVKKCKIHVCNEEKKPIAGAMVQIQILNYAEFFPVAQCETDAAGEVELTLGLGSCGIYVHQGEKSGFMIANWKEADEVTVMLSQVTAQETWEEFEVIAPVDSPIHAAELTLEQKQVGREKLEEALNIRKEKTGTGNEAEIQAFLNPDFAPEAQSWKEKLLGELTSKDLLDAKASILKECLHDSIRYKGDFPEDIFAKYLLSPRIAFESLSAYQKGIRSQLSAAQEKEFHENPNAIWTYIEQVIIEHPEREYQELITKPVPCLQGKVGGLLSKKVLFTAICRTLGIPARLNPVDGQMEYYENGSFHRVLQEAEKTAQITLSYDAKEKFTYRENWTLSKNTKGGYEVLNLEAYEGQSEIRLDMEPGEYQLLTCNRLPNGNIFGKKLEFQMKAGESKSFVLTYKEAELSEMLESITLPEFFVQDANGTAVSSKELLPGKEQLLVWLAVSQEPTEHILNELYEKREEFVRSQTSILCILSDKKDLENSTLKRTLEAIPQIQLYYDYLSENSNVLGRRMYVDPERLPLILVTDKEGKGIYATSGYNVGTADMLLKIHHRHESL